MDEVFTKIAMRVSEHFLHFDKSISSFVQQRLKSLVLVGVGVETDGWNRYKITGTNGYKAKIQELVVDLAKSHVTNEAGEILKGFMEIPDTKKALREVFQSCYKSAYAEAVYSELNRLIKGHVEEAKRRFEEEADGFIASMDATLDPILQVAQEQAREEIKRMIDDPKSRKIDDI